MQARNDSRTLADRALRPLLGLGLLLVVVHGLLVLLWGGKQTVPAPWNPLLLVNTERSVMTWVTIGLTFCFGAACLALGRLEGRRGWYGVAALFLFLSLDDQGMLHELIGGFAKRRMGSEHAHPWVVVLGPLFALAGILAFRWLWRTVAGETFLRRRILIAFAALGSSLFLELVHKKLQQSGIGFAGHSLAGYSLPVEEFLEFLAPALLLTVAAGLLERALRGESGDLASRRTSEDAPSGRGPLRRAS